MEQRQAYVSSHPDAKAADDKVNALTSDPAQKQQMYDISSDTYAGIVKQSGGDVSKQMELLGNAAKDPEAFMKSLTPAQQQEIRDLAGKMQPTKTQP